MSGSSKMALEPPAVARGDKADEEEHDPGDEIGRGVATRPFLLMARSLSYGAEEIGHADHCDERRAEQHADAEIDQSRDHCAQGLRQENELVRSPIAKTERISRLGLALRQRLQARADHLGKIG